MKIACEVKGSFKKLIDNLKSIKRTVESIDLDYYGKRGVEMLKETTPKDSTKTSESWSYTIENTEKGKILYFNNTNVTDEGTPIAILLEYGHATRGGTWFPGYNYINPAINAVVSELIDKINNNIR